MVLPIYEDIDKLKEEVRKLDADKASLLESLIKKNIFKEQFDKAFDPVNGRLVFPQSYLERLFLDNQEKT